MLLFGDGAVENVQDQNLRGVLWRFAWLPLEYREAVLVMHEVTVRVEEGAVPTGLSSAKRTIGRTEGTGFGVVRD